MRDSSATLGDISLARFGQATGAVVARFADAGIDVAPDLLRIAEALFPRELADARALARTRGEAALDSAEASIEACYRKLEELPADTNEYVRALGELRRLQQLEADALSAAFRSRQNLNPIAAARALEHAERLLACHEDPASDD